MKVYNVHCEITIPVGASNEKKAEAIVRSLLLGEDSFVNAEVGIHPLHDELGLKDFKISATHVEAKNIASEIGEDWKGAELYNDEGLDGLTPERIANEDRESARKEQIELTLLEAAAKLNNLGVSDEELETIKKLAHCYG